MPKSGTYIVAVSGGVDSISLLHALSRNPGLELIVAHFDHGIRPDSACDEQLVRSAAKTLNLTYIYERAELGPNASEATARSARYDFLRRARDNSGAQSIITAHHQDDLLETALLNLLRGTGRLGLTSLADNYELRRPLLNASKQEIVNYAREHSLIWREDSTNSDERYRRNLVRNRVVSKLTPENRLGLLRLIATTRVINMSINSLVTKLLIQNESGEQLNRRQFIALPHDVSKELLAAWLRANGTANFDRRGLERLVIAVKTLTPGKRVDVLGGLYLLVGRDSLTLRRASVE